MTLYKKGDPSNTNKYGGISLLSLPGKVFAIWPEKRLHNLADGTLMEKQHEFREGRSCYDAIFSL